MQTQHYNKIARTRISSKPKRKFLLLACSASYKYFLCWHFLTRPQYGGYAREVPPRTRAEHECFGNSAPRRNNAPPDS